MIPTPYQVVVLAADTVYIRTGSRIQSEVPLPHENKPQPVVIYLCPRKVRIYSCKDNLQTLKYDIEKSFVAIFPKY